jgi:diguanylate cyclase (GGDEF)-like protein
MEEDSVILIVDDDPTAIRIMVEAFKSNYHIKIATSGYEALRIATKGVDLILLDINLPDMNGMDIICQLKKDPVSVNIPVIFVTASSDAIIEEASIDLGAVDFVTKPYSASVLNARVRSILENTQLKKKLQKMAMTDSLTGLYNRRYFDNAFNLEWERHYRSQTFISLIMCDLDYFKKINDAYGHDAGDLVLKTISQLLNKQTKRSTDFAVRLGGEEFALVLPDTDFEGARYIAEQFRLAVQEQSLVVNDQTNITITVSLGVNTAAPESLQAKEEFINQADAYLYSAKNRGRNQVQPSHLIEENFRFGS